MGEKQPRVPTSPGPRTVKSSFRSIVFLEGDLNGGIFEGKNKGLKRALQISQKGGGLLAGLRFIKGRRELGLEGGKGT